MFSAPIGDPRPTRISIAIHSHSRRLLLTTGNKALGLCMLASTGLAANSLQKTAPLDVETQLAGPGITIAGGAVQHIPIAERPDQPRLPIGPKVTASDAGDEIVEAASGNPYFLGFAAGPHYPDADERIAPELLVAMTADLEDGRPQAETYAFAMFEGRITRERVDLLEQAGARILGYHPSNCIKIAGSAESLLTISSLEEVRWLGAPQAWQKLHPVLTREVSAARAESDSSVDVFISVYDSDLCAQSTHSTSKQASTFGPDGVREVPNSERPTRWRSRGWQEAQLLANGIETPIYIERARAFRSRVHPELLDELARLDFVAFIELAGDSAPLHDESMPMVNADWGRASFDGGTSNAVVAGEADWGMDTGHAGLDQFFGWGWNLGPGSAGAWEDGCGHGSHVGGTIIGSGDVESGKKGAAPGLGGQASRRFYNVKIGDNFCGQLNVDLAGALDRFEDDVFDGSVTTPKPHVINHSWGSVLSGPYFGTEVDARLIDNSIYLSQQLHVFSAGNNGPGGQSLTLQASAKNALSVGNVGVALTSQAGYPGNAWVSSSRGPTADFRWGPKVCAPGVNIDSVDAGTGNGYTWSTGTSMAAPHVTGIAAQLCDRHPFLRYNPSTLSAVLMAGALTKDSEVFTSPSFASNNHLNIYGTGRVDAYKASGGNGQQAMFFWGFGQNDSGYGQVEIPVGQGATQLTVVMTYNEIAGSPGASSALVNDLDLWIDRAPFSSGGDSGEYLAQHSFRDNTEVRIINSPVATDYRLKVFPEDVGSGLFNTSWVGLCAIVTYGDTTPAANLDVSTPDAYVQPGDTVTVNATVSNPSYIASAVYLEETGLGSILEATAILGDFAMADFKDNMHAGQKVMLGNIRHGTFRGAQWKTRWNNESTNTVSVTSSSDNAGVDTDQVTIYVDGTPPSGPNGFQSPSHQTGLSCDTSIDFTWVQSGDAISGVDGYLLTLDHSSSSQPVGSLNYSGTATSATLNVGASSQAWYAHLRARDRSGNWGSTQHLGPFQINAEAPYRYCTASLNSSSLPATIGFSGSTSVAANQFTLTCFGLPATTPGIFFYGPGENSSPFGDGTLCVLGPINRLSVVFSSGGFTSYDVDFTMLPPNGSITPGSEWKFQHWFRDVAAGGAGFNTSDGLGVTFCP